MPLRIPVMANPDHVYYTFSAGPITEHSQFLQTPTVQLYSYTRRDETRAVVTACTQLICKVYCREMGEFRGEC